MKSRKVKIVKIMEFFLEAYLLFERVTGRKGEGREMAFLSGGFNTVISFNGVPEDEAGACRVWLHNYILSLTLEDIIVVNIIAKIQPSLFKFFKIRGNSARQFDLLVKRDILK